MQGGHLGAVHRLRMKVFMCIDPTRVWESATCARLAGCTSGIKCAVIVHADAGTEPAGSPVPPAWMTCTDQGAQGSLSPRYMEPGQGSVQGSPVEAHAGGISHEGADEGRSTASPHGSHRLPLQAPQKLTELLQDSDACFWEGGPFVGSSTPCHGVMIRS